MRELALETDMAHMAIRAMKNAGVAATLPRVAVWVILARSDRPLQVKEIKRYSIENEMDLNLSSIYAALKRLTKEKLFSVHVVFGIAYYSLSDMELHQSIVCEESGRQYWFADHDLRHAIETFCRKHGFDMVGYMLTMHGQRIEAKDSANV